MGLVHPRPAMRAKEARVIEARLRKYNEVWKEQTDKGVSDEEAKKMAFEEAKKILYKK